MYGLRGELPEEEISEEGICEVNLEDNQLTDHAVLELMKFLRFDNWTRSLNLKYNAIGKDGVKEFVTLMKRNKSLIALDLRGNPGLDIESSKKIFNRLIKNIHSFKTYKENYGKKVK
jgi:Ran GTPase-activating protein (RanGAP) involved in mRNA processing and transport